MKYFHWDQKTITDFDTNSIDSMYERGYLFTRIGKGVMQQTRSLRIDLAKFELSSENRRILNKIPDLSQTITTLPLSDYNFSIGKIAKDFYENKFGPGIMSAQKIKEMLTDNNKSNFNSLITFQNSSKTDIGFIISYSSPSILHYSYPFYDLNNCPKDMGLAMMVNTIKYAKDNNKKYIYLGSLQRPTDTYKLQFSGLEWFDGNNWNRDLNEIKNILNSLKN
jgi:arginyl-tRNA--protein-N-Asp/Glu arginylyltransferase